MVFIADPHSAGYSGQEWSQQGKPVSEGYSRPSARMQLGIPAYDLRRFTEGPSLYINGAPDAGDKRLLSTEVQAMRHGRLATNQRKQDLTTFDCRKSKTGPDPYNVNTSNLWNQRKGSPRFSVENGESRVWTRPRPDCARSLNLDPYSVSTRDNPWMSFGRIPSARAPRPRLHVGDAGGGTPRSKSPRSVRSTTGYFSPFPESLNIGSRAHTPRISQTVASPTGRRNTWSGGSPGANTEPALSGSKAWDWGGVSPGGLSSPASLPPLPAACRF